MHSTYYRIIIQGHNILICTYTNQSRNFSKTIIADTCYTDAPG